MPVHKLFQTYQQQPTKPDPFSLGEIWSCWFWRQMAYNAKTSSMAKADAVGLSRTWHNEYYWEDYNEGEK